MYNHPLPSFSNGQKGLNKLTVFDCAVCSDINNEYWATKISMELVLSTNKSSQLAQKPWGGNNIYFTRMTSSVITVCPTSPQNFTTWKNTYSIVTFTGERNTLKKTNHSRKLDSSAARHLPQVFCHDSFQMSTLPSRKPSWCTKWCPLHRPKVFKFKEGPFLIVCDLSICKH